MAEPTPHGWYWEVVHQKTGQVVNSGYSREEMVAGETPVAAVRGFVMRVVPLFANLKAVAQVEAWPNDRERLGMRPLEDVDWDQLPEGTVLYKVEK